MANDETPLVKLLGPSLLRKPGTKVSTKDAFKGKDLVILYFSGKLIVVLLLASCCSLVVTSALPCNTISLTQPISSRYSFVVRSLYGIHTNVYVILQ